MASRILVLILFIRACLGAPFMDHFEPTSTNKDATLAELIEKVSNDTMMVVKSKAAVVQFLTETAANAAAEGGRNGVGFVSDVAKRIELEAGLNKTEEYVKREKIAMIGAVFNLKRQFLKAMESIQQGLSAQFQGVINGLNNNFNNALNATSTSISISKSAAADFYGSMSWNNTLGMINNSTDQLGQLGHEMNDAITNTTQAIQDAFNNYLNETVKAKEALAESVESFNSQNLFHQGEHALNVGINATFNGVGLFGNASGIFQALDNLIQSAVGIPNKINTLIGLNKKPTKKDQEQNDEQQLDEKDELPEQMNKQSEMKKTDKKAQEQKKEQNKEVSKPQLKMEEEPEQEKKDEERQKEEPNKEMEELMELKDMPPPMIHETIYFL